MQENFDFHSLFGNSHASDPLFDVISRVGVLAPFLRLSPCLDLCELLSARGSPDENTTLQACFYPRTAARCLACHDRAAKVEYFKCLIDQVDDEELLDKV